MSELRQVPKIYGFEDFEVRLEDGTLFRKGYNVPLQDQPFRLLALLVSRAGTVVTREEIQAHLWPANTNVEFDKSLRVAVSKLREALRDSANVPIYIETLPRRGYRFMVPVTVKALAPAEPEVTGIATGQTPAPIHIPPPPSGWRLLPVSHVVAWVAIAMVGVAASLYVGRNRLRHIVAPPVAAHTIARRSVAVIGLRNLSGSENDRWLSTGLAEMLSTELSTSERLRVISGEEVARAGLSEPPVNTPSHDSLVRYADQLGADMIVFGSYTVSRDEAHATSSQMRLELRMENLSSESQSVTLVKTGRTTDLFSLVSASGADLRRHFGLGEGAPDAATAVRRTLPSDPEAAQLYAEGLSRLRNFDAAGARDLLLKAARIEPAHAGTHLALADAWHAMAYIPQAQAEAKRAVELGTGLPREELLTMQGELATLSNDWPRAIDIYHSLSILYPDDVEIGLRLVAAQNGASRYPDAVATLKGLRRPGISRADEAKLDLGDASTSGYMGDFRPSIAQADKAIAIARELDNNLLRAQALSIKAFSLERLGNSADSLAVSTEAQALYSAANDKKGLAVSLLLSGDVIYDKGQTADARKNFLSALDLFREIGHRVNMGLSMERVGNSYYEEGALAESRKYYEQALDVYRELHKDALIGSAIGNIANVQDTEGDIPGALRSNGECVALSEKTGSKREMASALANMGVLEMERGNLTQASADFTRAADLDHQLGYARGLSHALAGQGDVLLERNDIAGTLRQYDLAARSIAMDEPEVGVPLQIGQGAANLMLGNADKAEQLLKQAVDTSVKNKEHALSTAAFSWLSRTLLVQGHLPEALDAANHAVAEAHAQFGPQGKASAALALARVLIAQGNSAGAQEVIRPALALAEHHGYEPLALELRIQQAQTAGAQARASQLKAIARIATAHGWNRIAFDARGSLR